MANPIYVGIENEHQFFVKKKPVSFQDECRKLYREYCKTHPAIKSYDYGIMTKHGIIYADSQEAEICTSPVMVAKGFATEITNLLLHLRSDLHATIGVGQDNALIGYSAHWNISESITSVPPSEFMPGLAIPFSLFALSPLSSGIRLREEREGRFELMGEYIHDRDQVTAFFLLYASSLLAYEAESDNLPFEVAYGDTKFRNLVAEGRSSPVDVRKKGEHGCSTISAQEYLEQYYALIKPHATMLGTKRELRLLDDFVSGKKELLIDKQEFYAGLREQKRCVIGSGIGKVAGFDYVPRLVLKRQHASGEVPSQPLQELYAYLMDENNKSIEDARAMWSYCGFSRNNEEYELEGIYALHLVGEILRRNPGPDSLCAAFRLLGKYDLPSLEKIFADTAAQDHDLRDLGVLSDDGLTAFGSAVSQGLASMQLQKDG
jgi:hypothetical protein